ncbi:MAG: HEAT repeat domain-containing protein [Verrucomicrobiota bacterium]
MLTLRPRDPLFRGKPESYWIEHLSYSDEEQVKQWRAYGPQGVRVLTEALQGADHPAERVYRRVYPGMARVLPGGLLRVFPAPRMDLTRSTRMRVVDLLSRLGNDAKPAIPAMARALRDEDSSVRQIAISFFTCGEDRNAPLNQMDRRTKSKLLPEFIRAMQDDNWGVRNNAAVALRYYPEQGQVVAAVLAKALKDPVPTVRQVAAESLNRVAPDRVVAAGVVLAVIGVLRHPDDQIASRAAQLLGEMRKEPSLAVPALLESVQSANSLVAATAARALGNFPEQADVIVPILRKVRDNTNSAVPRWASAVALKELDPTAAAKAGVR